MKTSIFARAVVGLATLQMIFCLGCKPKEETVSMSQSTNGVATETVTNETSVTTNPPVATTNEFIRPEEARNHVGETAMVRGKVFRVYETQKADVFIDVGGKHPNAPFTVACFQQKIPTEELKKLDGKIVSFQGKIKDYQGKIEIILETGDQIIP